MGEMLTQEEINQLLSNSSSIQKELSTLSDLEMDTLGEIGNISMGSAATVLHNLLGRRVTITTPVVTVTNYELLKEHHDVPYVAVRVSYIEGLHGDNMLIIKTSDVKAITSILIGSEDFGVDEEELGELHLSAISEVMNQMMGASATSMSKLINMPINISPPKADIINFKQEKLDSEILNEQEELVAISFTMEIEGLFTTEIMLLMGLQFSKNVVESFFQQHEEQKEQPQAVVPEPVPEPAPMPSPASVYAQEPVKASEPVREYQPSQSAGSVNVKPVQLERFEPVSDTVTGENIDLLMDVPLQVTVELGRTKRTLMEILELNVGSVITLDKLVGEPVDVVVNGKMVAKGEVVVVDDNFAVRIVDIIKANKRSRIM
ncbi:MAG: flagellar motor switch phosphatase FliY [Clostridia bacterium]|nr:flagellar motor switch phosphatase FliY [Clostridia bacterium]